MKKYLIMLKYELKTIVKDSTNLFMLFYPLMMVLILVLLIPAIMERTNAGSAILMIGVAFAFSAGSFMAGALLAFSLIENKDENTIYSIAVTPLELTGYTNFKLIYSFLFSLIGNFIIIGGIKLFASDVYVIQIEDIAVSMLDQLSWIQILIFIFVTSLFVPTVALVISSFAKNKIEGFAIIKGGGLLVVLPILSVMQFFSNAKQYILGIMPIFWPVKAMLNEAMMNQDSSNLSYGLYMIIGIAYMLILFALSYRMYMRKLKS